MNSPVCQRGEDRSPQEIVVTLFGLDPVQYEVTTTKDVSPHGACVLTGKPWVLNQLINVRSHQFTFLGLARVVRCRPEKGDSYTMGLEFIFVTGNWMKSRWEATAPWATAASLFR